MPVRESPYFNVFKEPNKAKPPHAYNRVFSIGLKGNTRCSKATYDKSYENEDEIRMLAEQDRLEKDEHSVKVSHHRGFSIGNWPSLECFLWQRFGKGIKSEQDISMQEITTVDFERYISYPESCKKPTYQENGPVALPAALVANKSRVLFYFALDSLALYDPSTAPISRTPFKVLNVQVEDVPECAPGPGPFYHCIMPRRTGYACAFKMKSTKAFESEKMCPMSLVTPEDLKFRRTALIFNKFHEHPNSIPYSQMFDPDEDIWPCRNEGTTMELDTESSAVVFMRTLLARAYRDAQERWEDIFNTSAEHNKNTEARIYSSKGPESEIEKILRDVRDDIEAWDALSKLLQIQIKAFEESKKLLDTMIQKLSAIDQSIEYPAGSAATDLENINKKFAELSQIAEKLLAEGKNLNELACARIDRMSKGVSNAYQRVTVWAIPFMAVTGFYGMNLKQLSGSGLSLWTFVATLVMVAMVGVITSRYYGWPDSQGFDFGVEKPSVRPSPDAVNFDPVVEYEEV